MRRAFVSPDFLLFLALTFAALGIMLWQHDNIEAEAASTLAGAIFGGAALLLGNWLNRFGEATRERDSLATRRQQLEAVIRAELRTVAIGLLTAKDHFLDLSRSAPQQPGRTVKTAMAALLAPTDLPLTMGLGSELLILDAAALDSLITLQGALSNFRGFIATAGEASEDVSASILESWAAITRSILGGPLLNCFKLIAPQERLTEGKLATVVLLEAATAKSDQATS
jgi:hypothetical protein